MIKKLGEFDESYFIFDILDLKIYITDQHRSKGRNLFLLMFRWIIANCHSTGSLSQNFQKVFDGWMILQFFTETLDIPCPFLRITR